MLGIVDPLGGHSFAAEHEPFVEKFPGPALDPKRWRVANWAYGPPSDVQERVKNTGEAVRVANGLYLSARRVEGEKDYNFISSRVEGIVPFLYGRFEFEAKLPSGHGLWPALWLRTPFGPPINGEIDALEGHGGAPWAIQSSLHEWDAGKSNGISCGMLVTLPGHPAPRNPCGKAIALSKPFLPSDAYHTYTVLWSKSGVEWLVDGESYFSTRESPSVPMVIVLNLSISSRWDGGIGDLKTNAELCVRRITVS